MLLDSVEIRDEKGNPCAVLAQVDNSGALILKAQSEHLITASFEEHTNEPYIRIANSDITTILGCHSNNFNITVSDTRTKMPQCSIVMKNTGEILITRYDSEGVPAQESLEDLVSRLIQNALKA